ncbi:MAG: YbhB/YbcL family Raf kinase inhibitor-like protein [Haloferacaceae archaeon]
MVLQLSSPAFDDGYPIPREYGYTEENANPPLEISGVPEGAASLVLVMDDPDAVEPAGKIWDHWLVWNVDPTRKKIPEDWNTATASATEGKNDYGEPGYGGPNPPDGEHTYRFRLYALDAELDVPAGADKDRLELAMEDHVLDEATLEGTYAP